MLSGTEATFLDLASPGPDLVWAHLAHAQFPHKCGVQLIFFQTSYSPLPYIYQSFVYNMTSRIVKYLKSLLLSSICSFIDLL